MGNASTQPTADHTHAPRPHHQRPHHTPAATDYPLPLWHPFPPPAHTTLRPTPRLRPTLHPHAHQLYLGGSTMAPVVAMPHLHSQRIRIPRPATRQPHPRPQDSKKNAVPNHSRTRLHKPGDAPQMAYPLNTAKNSRQCPMRNDNDSPRQHQHGLSGICHTLRHACTLAASPRLAPRLGRRQHGAPQEQNAHHTPHRHSTIHRLRPLCKHRSTTAQPPRINGLYQPAARHSMVCHHHLSDNANPDTLRPQDEERLANESDCDPGKSYSPYTNLSSDHQGNYPDPCPSPLRGLPR